MNSINTNSYVYSVGITDNKKNENLVNNSKGQIKTNNNKVMNNDENTSFLL